MSLSGAPTVVAVTATCAPTVGAGIPGAVETVETTPAQTGTPTVAAKLHEKYCVRYKGNTSKRWDGREILLDAEWLESLYDPLELIVGKKVRLPWRAKGGIQHWNAVVIRPEDKPKEGAKEEASNCTGGKGKGIVHIVCQ